MKLTEDDFPVQVIGNRIYGRTQSSPIAVAQDDAMAHAIAARLNFSDIAGFESEDAK